MFLPAALELAFKRERRGGQILLDVAAPEAQAHARILSELYAESRRSPHPLTLDIALDIIISHTIAPHTADDPLPKARETTCCSALKRKPSSAIWASANP